MKKNFDVFSKLIRISTVAILAQANLRKSSVAPFHCASFIMPKPTTSWISASGQAPGCLRINGQRIQRRGGMTIKLNQYELKRQSIASENFVLYWLAFKLWVWKHTYNNICGLGIPYLRVKPTFELAPETGDSRGRLYYIRLDFVSDATVPRWFPSFAETPESRRNFLHISVFFTGNIAKMKKANRKRARRYIRSLETDSQWNGATEQVTYVSYCPNGGGTFHLAGFENDKKMRWLHEHGSYANRSFGHIALYAGGLYRC